MKVKLDENVTVAVRELLAYHGHKVDSVPDEGITGAADHTLLEACRDEDRLLVTFDLGFGDIRAYPPGTHPGILLLRLHNQQPDAVLDVLQRLLAAHDLEQLKACLIVVTEERIRIRRE